MTTATEPTVWSQTGGLIVLAAIVWTLVILRALARRAVYAITRRRRARQAAALPRPAAWHYDTCSRCSFPGALIRRERSTRQLVRVCYGHAHEGDVRGWWMDQYPFDRAAADVVDQATQITKRAAS